MRPGRGVPCGVGLGEAGPPVPRKQKQESLDTCGLRGLAHVATSRREGGSLSQLLLLCPGCCYPSLRAQAPGLRGASIALPVSNSRGFSPTGDPRSTSGLCPGSGSSPASQHLLSVPLPRLRQLHSPPAAPLFSLPAREAGHGFPPQRLCLSHSPNPSMPFPAQLYVLESPLRLPAAPGPPTAFLSSRPQSPAQESQELITDYGAYHQPDYEYSAALPELHPTPRMTFFPTGTIRPYASALNPSHNGQVCSTWGNFHYKTFDGDIFQFPGLCNYVFASHCQTAYEDFNIQIRRSLVGETSTISRILLKTEGMVLELSPNVVLINGQREQLPYSQAGFTVEASSTYIKVSMRMVLTFLWNGDDSALLQLDAKYANQTCGLCGDFNGLPTYNEFYSNNVRLIPLQFGNLQKLDGPTEQCQDPLPSPANNCTDEEGSCLRVLYGPAFRGCNQLVDPQPYVEACVQDLCDCKEADRSSCLCATFSEYSRQCAHAGGQPLNWRSPGLCNKECPFNMQYHECGSPCMDTCSNPERSQLCEEHCLDGCFCPPGTVLDDIQGQGCVTLDQCHCTHNGQTYKPGASFSTRCSSCTCLSGLWQCEELPCPGTCSVEGGSHITTFDQKRYNVHGDCSYVLSKKCNDATFTILGELRKCGMTDNENCLKSVSLNLNEGETVVRIQPSGAVFVNSIYMQLPISAANITIFQASTHFILVHAAFGLLLQIQLVPLMQVSMHLDPSFRGQMCGLCGNFNQNQADDFTATSGVVEGTGAAFANTWKTQANCPNIRNSFENPCSLSVENENYAQHWCSLLVDHGTIFSQCHAFVNPAPYFKNCMFDTCNCEKSEDCLCASLSSYVQACAAQGVLLSGWRSGVCTKYMDSCPSSLSYSYVVESCQPTCRSLSEPDVTCSVHFDPVDGCVCPKDTYLNDAGQCVPATQCPCYFKGTMVALGETIQENGAVCSCTSGKLSCFGDMDPSPVCTPPMVYLDCNNASAGTLGAQCQKSCDTLDVACYNAQCVSGCICPEGLVKDGNNGCVKEEDCPCVHNEASYKSGETIRVDCNNCTCKNRRWECTQAPCLGTCAVYGDGHFITFDSERYSFEGNCEYTLVQDYCGGNTTTNGTFRVITENIPCGTTGVTCSKAIKVFLKGTELIFNEGHVKMVARGTDKEIPYKIHSRGIYMVLETQAGMVLMWDRKTSIFIKLHQRYKGKVCGLCGNYDGNSLNDFTTRSLSVVGDVQEFGNSWKLSPTCPDAVPVRDPCTANPYRKAWAQKQCSIINSAVFAACHPQVDSTKYYEACVSDACACDSGGDCECFCTAVAAYAQACNDVGVCISWRKPDICPMFCDFYNPHGECDWHYQPCGAPCLKTCGNPSGKCLVDLPGLEGCYPDCPAEKPFFSESQMKCVDQCGCYDEEGNYYEVGDKVVSQANCQSCNCTTSGIQCTPDQNECTCLYEGHTYHIHEVIYNTTDGLGACLIAICGENGTIERMSKECPGTPSTSAPFTFTTRLPESTAEPTTTVSAASTVCVQEVCEWSDWYDGSTPGAGLDGGDFDTFENLRLSGYSICPSARDVQCRARAFPSISLAEVGQKVECSLSRGLLCYNAEQEPPLCHDYEIRVLCCSYVPCGGSTTTGTRSSATRSTMSLQTLSNLTSQTWSVPPRASTTTGPCQPQCQWTEWFDTDYPKSEAVGADIETYDKIRSTGKKFCREPQGIECQAENYPNMTLEEVGQVVYCDVHFGFICRNEEQSGLFKMCLNYKIKVLCCDDSNCHTTTPVTRPVELITSTTAQTSLTTKSLVTESSPVTSATRESTPITPLSTHSPPGTEVTITTSSSAPHPTTTAISSTAKTSAASTSTPLATTTKMVKVKTTATPGSTQGTVKTSSPLIKSSTETVQTTQRQSTNSEISTATTQLSTTLKTQTTTLVPLGPTSTSTITSSQVTTLVSTPCQPKCEWTEWFDTDYPKSEAVGADIETYDKIRSTGKTFCREPQGIECQAENYPNMTLEEVGQVVHCDVHFGFICRNEEQLGLFKMCHNYKIKVLCCDDSNCHTTTPVTRPVEPTTSLRTGTTAQTSLTTKSLVTESSPVTFATRESTPITPLSTRSPPGTKVTRTTSSSAPHPTTTAISSTAASTSTPMPTTTKMIEMETTATPGSTQGTVKTSSPLIKSSTETVQTTQRQSTNSEISTATTQLSTTLKTQTTTLVPPGPTSTSTITSSQVTTLVSTPCQPKCEWTEWFDMDFPSSGINGGDFETYDNIRKAGGKICTDPKKLECRAENYPEVSIDQIGQVLQCNQKFGLICKNKDQKGKFKMCFNYNIRALCCNDCPSLVTETAKTPSTPQNTTELTTPTSTLMTSTKEATSTFQTSGKNPTSSQTQGTTWKFTSSKPSTTLVFTKSILTTPGKFTTARTSIVKSTTARTHIVPTSGATEVTKLSQTAPRSPSISSSFGTTSTSQSTPLSPIALVSTGATSPTECQPRCVWTDWIDQSYPIPGEDGGDFETYDNIWATGKTLCAKPQEIQCRAENYPTLPLSQVGQNVECNVSIGLICRNRDQAGSKYCLNYHIKVLCCDDYRHCKTTSSPPVTTSTMTPGSSPLPTKITTQTTQTPSHPTGTTQKVTPTRLLSTLSSMKTRSVPTVPTSSESTTVSGGTTLSLSPTPSSVPASTGLTSPMGSSTTSIGSTSCAPICIWTDWIDQSYPIPGKDGGDFETYDNIRASGKTLCEKPEEIQCRAENYMNLNIDQLGQVVDCNVNTGLVCRNRDQSGRFKMCLNYHIKVLCCDYSHCSTTARPETPYLSTLSTTARSRIPPSLSTLSTVGTHSGSTPILPTLTSTSSATPSGSTAPTTQCVPRCRWTEWFDTHKPKPGRFGGDIETYYSITDAGGKICLEPKAIECQSSVFPDTPLEQLEQVVWCDVDYGLICRNSKQKVPDAVCLNYRIRVQCCDDYSHCATSPPTTSTASTGSASWTTLSTSTTAMSASSRSPSTSPTSSLQTESIKSPPVTVVTEKVTSSGPVTSLRPTSTIPSSTGSSAPTTAVTRPVASTTARTHTAPTSGTTEVTKLSQTAPRSPSTSSSFGTTSTSQSTPLSPIALVSTGATSPTECQPRCVWTDWIDQSYPIPGEDGGDFETYDNIWATGKTLCAKPQEIQCRAENYPTLPLSQVGQNVECNVSIGLICRNRDQAGSKYCLNYHIKVLCCDDYRHCKTTSSPPVTTSTMTPGSSPLPTKITTQTTQTPSHPTGTTQKVTPTRLLSTLSSMKTRSVPTVPTSSESTTVSGGTTLSLSPTPSSVPASTGLTSPMGSSTTSIGSTSCAPICIWTDWIDQSYPIPGKDGGDFETYDNIRASGKTLCEKPEEIQCRAENYMNLNIDQLGQVVDCNVNTGLVCRNRDQSGRFKMCLNYHIKVLCCDYSHCSTTARPETSYLSTLSTTARSRIPPSLSTLSTVGTHSGSTPILPTLTSTSSATPSGSTAPTTQCVPRCRWTEWFDTHKPKPGQFGGDIETYYSITDAGGKICLEPKAIECQSSVFPDTPLEQLEQVVWCDVDYGLICRNSKQKVPDAVCLNYRIRVQCCDDYSHCATSPPTTSTASTGSASWTTLSTSTTAMSASSRSPSTSPTSSLQTESIKSPPVTVVTEKVTSSGPVTSLRPTSTIPSSTGSSAPTTAVTRPVASTTARTHTAPTSRTTEVTKLSQTAPRSPSTSSSFGTTSTSQSTPLSPIASVSTGATSPTECQPRCVWTDWIDQSYPIPGKDGGDFETYDNIRASGKTLCEKPEEIQCRAENYMNLNIDQLGQVVDCNVNTGLVCRNRDQSGRFKMCLNYHIKVLCCDYSHCSTTARPETPYLSTLSTTARSRIPPSLSTLSTAGTHSGSTPILPTLTSTSSATPSGSTAPTTQCVPRCRWTEWFDTHKPKPGRFGGDIETYYSITDAGGKICLEPKAIECQSSVFPDTPLEQLEQVVWCDVDYGLICRNSKQKVPDAVCLNYRIRVQCCDDYSHCATSPPTTSTASTGSASWTTLSTSTTAMSASSRSPSTSPTSSLQTESIKSPPVTVVTEKVTSSGPVTSLRPTSTIPSSTGSSAPTTAVTRPVASTTARTHTAPTSGTTEVTKLSQTAPRSPSTSSSFGTTSTSQSTPLSPIASVSTGATSPTECQPRCVWTDWIDQSYPIPGEDGGDFETYDNIWATGKTLCAKPQEIQCRAENYPTLPLSQVGQNVECNVSIGLICRNRDQAGSKYCLNYHIKVLCCDDYRHCITPSSNPSTASSSRTPHLSTSTLQTSTISTFSTSVSVPPTSQPTLMPSTFTTPCFCFVSGDLFSPGEVIYNKTDKAGCSFFAICNQHCEIERFNGPCPTPTPTVPQTTPPPGCYDVHPPRQPGEQWTSNCQDCICDNSSLTVQCRPVQCPEPTPPPKCQKEGFVIVYRARAENPCCMEAHCVCNQSSCPQDQPGCGPQEELFSFLPLDTCCPVFGCREKMCEHNGTTYGIGSSVPSDLPCHTCTCRAEVNPATNSTVWCEPERCPTTCGPDQEYHVRPGQCCGQCEPAGCLTPDDKWIKLNETWVNPGADNCTEYLCQKVDGDSILSPRPAECPEVPLCQGVLRKVGCCYECEELQENCRVQSNETLLRYKDCVSETAVNLTFCAGSCASTSMYSLEANEMQRKCTCCRETRVHQEEVKMKCPDGTEIRSSYTHVDACSCLPACLPSHTEVFAT
ncbi:mucin-5B [Antechinus flavipes]|uniref:mucin-5B n=1 Tax=Antechinus flavipes TaxID=38775 RepID=UPI002235AA35|nr:mucin-5B [Antechinus flavipes]